MDTSLFFHLFANNEISLGACESFTGGLFSSFLTSIPGASSFFKGSLVTYATEEKNRVLGISTDLINKYGVVSKQVCSEMAAKGRIKLNSDYCISFTGNAGPTALENKPVGEIYIGVCDKALIRVKKYLLTGSRKEIQEQGVKLGLKFIFEFVKEREKLKKQ